MLRELHQYYIEVDAEALPDDPPTNLEQRVAGWRHISDRKIVPRWLLRDAGEIVAVAVAHMNKHDDVNNGFAWIHVRPDLRRRGYARLLATPVLQRLEQEGRPSLITDVWDGVGWLDKLVEVGLKLSFRDTRSRLLVDEIDWGLMDAWIERAPERGSDYHLLYLETPIPEEHIEQWCRVQHVMDTAPREDLEFEMTSWTPEKWREDEEKQMLAGHRLVGHVAVHSGSGDFVGLSDIQIHTHQPEFAWQADTGVDPEHRNMGLGRWMKAATIKKVIDGYPALERIDTENASSNDPMLKINHEMGYRPILRTNVLQGDLSVVREQLDV